MKHNKTVIRLFAILFVSTVFFACKKKDAVAPDNEITETTSLEVFTNWSLNDASTATVGADIDVLLVKGNVASQSQYAALTLADRVSYSDNTGDFETTTILSSLPDGDYSVILEYWEILKPGKYNIRFKGTASGKAYNIADISFTVAEDGDLKFPAKITKAGQKFTITKR